MINVLGLVYESVFNFFKALAISLFLLLEKADKENMDELECCSKVDGLMKLADQQLRLASSKQEADCVNAWLPSSFHLCRSLNCFDTKIEKQIAAASNN